MSAPDLEAAILRILDGPKEHRATLFGELCEAHAEQAEAIRQRIAAVGRKRAEAAVVNEFLQLYAEDAGRAEPRSLEDYRRRWPGHEQRIAHEHARLRNGPTASHRPGSPTDSEPSDRDPPGREYAGQQHTAPDNAAPDPAAPDPAATPTEIGPYKILDTLGEGGMGKVYLAEQRRPVRRRVALKVIKLGMDSLAVVARFEAERQALAMMEHSCIATVYDAGLTPQGQPFFAMEYVKGIPLTDYCDQHKLDLEQRIELLQKVCSGVQHAHLKGVMHRDLKPGNVLVTLQDGQPTPKIIDFGLAKATDHHLVESTLYTEQGQVIGTPEYMSPEQAGLDGLDVDSRTDVYSLGVLLYELLVGELPFPAEQLRSAGYLEMQRLIREQDPIKPSTRVSNTDQAARKHATTRRLDRGELPGKLRGDLDWIVMRALEKDRTRRYETAQELAADLQRHLDFEPVLASPPSAMYRLRKYVRRYRAQCLMAAVLLLAILGGGIGTTLGWAEANEQKQRAEDNEQRALASAATARTSEAKAMEQRQLADERAARIEVMARKDRIYGDLARLEWAQQLAAKLHPAWPQNIAAMRRWLTNHGQPLAARLSDIRQQLQQRRQQALPWTEAEQQRDRSTNPQLVEWQYLQHWLQELRYADAIRRGDRQLVEHELTAEQRALTPDHLNRIAWQRVMPYPWEPSRRRTHFGEAAVTSGLAFARLAVEKGSSSNSTHMYLDTLAWALLANGQDQAARTTSAAALLAAPAKDKTGYLGYQRQIEAAIEHAAETLAATEVDFRELSADVASRRTWSFASDSASFHHQTLERLQDELHRFRGPLGQLQSVRERLAWAEAVHQRSIEAHHPAWEAAISAIQSSDGHRASLLYRGLDLVPQLGLVPIGMDPESRLWEFVHLRSGTPAKEIPARDPQTRQLRANGDMGLVFVLIPGGTLPVEDGKSPDHRHSVQLDPYFFSKYEMTQGQWVRLSDRDNPSLTKHRLDLALPVERVSWRDCEQLLGNEGLLLPTDLQWEYGCRAGTTTRWWSGPTEASMRGKANLSGRLEAVGSLVPNAFGLYDVAGNLYEWCRDVMGDYGTERAGDGFRSAKADDSVFHFYRGGYFGHAVHRSASSYRYTDTPWSQDPKHGVRPSRTVQLRD